MHRAPTSRAHAYYTYIEHILAQSTDYAYLLRVQLHGIVMQKNSAQRYLQIMRSSRLAGQKQSSDGVFIQQQHYGEIKHTHRVERSKHESNREGSLLVMAMNLHLVVDIM